MLDEFSADVLARLADFCDQRGLAVQGGSGTYSDTTYDFKVKFAVKSEDGEVLTYERKMFPNYATMFGLKLEWLDKPFISAGKTYTIIGINPNSRVRPVVTRSNEGTQTDFPVSMVQKALDPEGYAAKQKLFAQRNALDPVMKRIAAASN
jgi:hypothetical protein